MDGSDTSPTFECSSLLTSPDPDEYDEHNMWNPMLGLSCHVQHGALMEAYFDEVDMGRIALSCHFLWMYYVTGQRCRLHSAPLPLVTSLGKAPCCNCPSSRTTSSEDSSHEDPSCLCREVLRIQFLHLVCSASEWTGNCGNVSIFFFPEMIC